MAVKSVCLWYLVGLLDNLDPVQFSNTNLADFSIRIVTNHVWTWIQKKMNPLKRAFLTSSINWRFKVVLAELGRLNRCHLRGLLGFQRPSWHQMNSPTSKDNAIPRKEETNADANWRTSKLILLVLNDFPLLAGDSFIWKKINRYFVPDKAITGAPKLTVIKYPHHNMQLNACKTSLKCRHESQNPRNQSGLTCYLSDQMSSCSWHRHAHSCPNTSR